VRHKSWPQRSNSVAAMLRSLGDRLETARQRSSPQNASAGSSRFPISGDLGERNTFTRVKLYGLRVGFQRLEAHCRLVGKVLNVKALA
jgi:hypothetical protein